MNCLYLSNYLLVLGLLLVILTNMTASSYCLLGYEQGPIICKDYNECKNNTCGDNATCHNTVGNPYCQCKPEYQPNRVKFTEEQGVLCSDEDECVDKENRCGNNTVCYNTIGSFYCQCEPGYQPEFVHFTAAEGEPCEDINECEGNQSICGLNAVCYNNIGSYHCMCAPGFVASNGQERFNASQKVTCNETKTRSEDKTQCAPDGVCYKISKYCTNTAHSPSTREQQQFNPILLSVLPVSLWIQINYQ
ncbi:hypothetical protein KOW79_019619 [Hemibagrus wyckioides]|uniref:EGF-like domain-containing protein n=1 Tax=Hemibagrus wyckioides TaxID=337641 RepID=A0A9D3N619_9TELE|nr:hypothetical protein KOW79_019619 [Hemibagrus wyckioides]